MDDIKNQRGSAYHESAHALIAKLVGWQIRYLSVSVREDKTETAWIDECRTTTIPARYNLHSVLLVKLAGPANDEKYFDRKIVTPGRITVEADLIREGWPGESEGDIADAIHALFAIAPKASDGDLYTVIRWYVEEVRALLDANWPVVASLAEQLYCTGHVDGSEVREVLTNSEPLSFNPCPHIELAAHFESVGDAA